MANPWFRLYSEFASDHKMQMMSEAYQRRYVMLLCLRCSNGDVTLQDEEVAFQLRISSDEWSETKSVFIGKNLIDKHNKVLAWERRQFISDSSVERVRKHREKKKHDGNVTVTPPDTDQNRADSEQNSEEKKARKARHSRELDVIPDPDFGGDKLVEVWRLFVDQRRNAKNPMTAKGAELAIKILRKSFDSGFCPVAIVEKSIMNGWSGIFAAKPGDERLNGKPLTSQLTHHQATKLAASRMIFGDERTIQNERIIDITPVSAAPAQLGAKDF